MRVLQIRMPAEDYAAVVDAATAAGMSPTEYARARVLGSEPAPADALLVGVEPRTRAWLAKAAARNEMTPTLLVEELVRRVYERAA